MYVVLATNLADINGHVGDLRRPAQPCAARDLRTFVNELPGRPAWFCYPAVLLAATPLAVEGSYGEGAVSR